jgi:hypothetical protein
MSILLKKGFPFKMGTKKMVTEFTVLFVGVSEKSPFIIVVGMIEAN